MNLIAHSHPQDDTPTALAAGVPAGTLLRRKKVANREIRVWHFVIENGY